MQQRRGTPLPAPTPTELAAVRALVEPHLDRKPGRVAVVAAVTLGVLLVGAGVLLGTRAADPLAWYPWQLLGLTSIWTLPALDRAVRRRRARARVRARLAEAAQAPDGAGRAVFSPFERRALVGCLVLDSIVVVAGLMFPERPLVLPAAWAAVTVLLVGAVGGALVATLRSPLVGTGRIVPTVDAALRRREVAEVLPLAVVPLLLSVAVRGAEPLWTVANGVLGLNVVVLAVAWFLRQDDLLLRDPRLTDAPEPEQWLAGAAA